MSRSDRFLVEYAAIGGISGGIAAAASYWIVVGFEKWANPIFFTALSAGAVAGGAVGIPLHYLGKDRNWGVKGFILEMIGGFLAAVLILLVIYLFFAVP